MYNININISKMSKNIETGVPVFDRLRKKMVITPRPFPVTNIDSSISKFCNLYIANSK
jgi:hypothetical protein